MSQNLLARAALGAVLAVGLGTAACGGTEDAAPEATAYDSAASPASAATATAAATPAAGGSVVQVAQGSPDHTTLVTAVTAAGLAETLSGAGPFTVFAPTNAAFGKLPAGTVEQLTQPAQREQLTGILTYHVVPGRLAAADLLRQIEAGGGSATLTTVNGATLTARPANGGVQLTDGSGGMAMVTQADLQASNGVIHVIDTVLMPRG